MTRPSTDLLIVGTGALATLFAARLASSGVGVTLLGNWPEALEVFNREGARLILPDESEISAPVRAIDWSTLIQPVQYALVLVKSWQTPLAAIHLAANLHPDGVALTLQNGLGNDTVLASRLGSERVAVGVTTTGASLLAPGLAKFGGSGKIDLAEHPRLDPLINYLRKAGFPVEAHTDVLSLQWGKLVINAAINPLTALLDVPNGALLDNPAARLFMRAAAEESANVAAVLGIRLPFADPASAAEDVARRTAANISSMLQDVRRGVPTEIEAICGAVVQAAQSAGVDAPLNQVLLSMVKARQPHMQAELPIQVPRFHLHPHRSLV